MSSGIVFLAEPPRTPYDLHFSIAGISVRVTPFFWLAAFLLGWGLVQPISTFEGMPHAAVLYLLWMGAVFLSILIHEMGHALAMRYYGVHAYVVLYHFGGLAVPTSSGSSLGSSRRMDSKSQIVISAAGPGAQLLLAALIVLLARVAGHSTPFLPTWIEDFLPQEGLTPIPSIPLQLAAGFVLLPSIFWALLNLLPVYPLDGGQIARELFMIFNARDGMRNSLILSILTGAAVAIWGFSSGQVFLAMMFGMLAFSSYQILQAYTGGGGFGGYGGGRPW